tara:strand:+ start:2819 stop:3958 length:1140 start_codon:yes stop_codon:yes gene_type:complete
MKALVLGVGRMGTAIAYAMDKFGFHVVGMDTNPAAADNIPKKTNLADGKTPNNEFFIVKDAEDICKGIEGQEKPDIVISSLPYHQTETVGKWCVDNGVRYCDLGGRVDVSQNINKYAEEKATKPVFTDLGLAPGWVNILAEHGYKQMHGEQVESVRMMVGGLPTERKNPPLNYTTTWSVDGLINEYKDSCEILHDGKISVVPGMEGWEVFNGGPQLGPLEAFYTSGGASHTIKTMHERGVKHCYYKTIRYEGHRNIIKFLIENSSEECLKELLKNGCTPSEKDVDIVLVKTLVQTKELSWDKDLYVLGDQQQDEPRFSAMQKATAFPIASVAKIMAEGKLEGDHEQHRDYWTQYPKSLSYSYVPYKEFDLNLRDLGINV